MRAGIQYDLISRELPGFPFDFAQGGEPVEPRVSLNPVSSAGQAAGLARNDSFVELRHSPSREGNCKDAIHLRLKRRGILE
jgi:hypothetical protein